jgi:hypothetical protein
MDDKLLAEYIFDIDRDMEQVIKILSGARDNRVYANILASHGSLTNRAGAKPRLPISVRLFVIATRGYSHQQGRTDPEEKHAIKYLKVLREGVEEEIEERTSFHDQSGCLTVLGEKTLANMMLVMGAGQTYKEYYGAEFPNISQDRKYLASRYTFQEKGVQSGTEWEWSAPFLSLKIYSDKYNEQGFHIGNEERKKRFGVLFQYTDGEGDIKNICLHINIEKEWISLSQIFEKLEQAQLFARLRNLNFDFTHSTCRHVSAKSDLLTRTFSNKGSESSSKRCFIHKFDEKYRAVLERSLSDFETIYDFYNQLKKENYYDKFLELLEANFNPDYGTYMNHVDEYYLFKFITARDSWEEVNQEREAFIRERELARDRVSLARELARRRAELERRSKFRTTTGALGGTIEGPTRVSTSGKPVAVAILYEDDGNRLEVLDRDEHLTDGKVLVRRGTKVGYVSSEYIRKLEHGQKKRATAAAPPAAAPPAAAPPAAAPPAQGGPPPTADGTKRTEGGFMARLGELPGAIYDRLPERATVGNAMWQAAPLLASAAVGYGLSNYGLPPTGGGKKRKSKQTRKRRKKRGKNTKKKTRKTRNKGR